MTGTHIFVIVALIFAGVAGATKVKGSEGRLLTPEEGCGFHPPNRKFVLHHHKSWPWVGSLLTSFTGNNAENENCTATLITSRHALTSANCASYRPRSIRLGETYWIFYDITGWVLHPEAKVNELKNNIAILFLARDVEFSDLIRPACLPTKATIVSKRITGIYRLVRENIFGVIQVSAYRPKNYIEVEMELCELIHSVSLSDQTAFCAYGDDESGQQGDPFVVKVTGENGTTPIYQVGLDAIHKNSKAGIFLDLYPYVQWINDTITRKTAKNIHTVASTDTNFDCDCDLEFFRIESSPLSDILTRRYS